MKHVLASEIPHTTIVQEAWSKEREVKKLEPLQSCFQLSSMRNDFSSLFLLTFEVSQLRLFHKWSSLVPLFTRNMRDVVVINYFRFILFLEYGVTTNWSISSILMDGQHLCTRELQVSYI